MLANALSIFQCVISALSSALSVRYPMRYSAFLLESQYKGSDTLCVMGRSKIDYFNNSFYILRTPDIGIPLEAGGNALGNALSNALSNALVTHWKTGIALASAQHGKHVATCALTCRLGAGRLFGIFTQWSLVMQWLMASSNVLQGGWLIQVLALFG